MRTRDVAVILLSVVALVGLLSQEGTISVRESFYVRMFSVGHHRYLPHPIISDIDGDGYNDLIVVTQPERLGLVTTRGVGSHVPSTLEPSKTYTTFSNIIGVSTGYISFPGNHTVQSAASAGFWFRGNTKKRHALQGHQQHVAVVTDDYRLSLLNAALVEVWTTSIVETAMSNMIPRKAVVTILPDRIFDHDMGVVIVAMQVAGSDSVPQQSIAAFDGSTGSLRWRHFVDSSASEILSEVATNFTSAGLSFKFTEKDLTEHSNTLEWTKFREAVIATMPSSYRHPWDSSLSPFRFVHTKNRKKAVHNGEADSPSGRPKEHHALRPKDAFKNDIGELGERYASAMAGDLHGIKGGARRQHLRPLPNVLVFRFELGVYYIHLFTGRTVTSIAPLKSGAVYDDLDDDLVLDVAENDIGVSQEQFRRHGVDEKFVCDGVIKTNAAGSPSETTRVPICETEGYISSLGLLRHVLRGDAAEQFVPHLDPLNRIGSHNIGDRSTQATTPVVAHLRHPIGRHIFRSQRLALFMVSHGVVTAVDSKKGVVLWRLETPSSFELRVNDDVHDASTTSWFHATTPEERDSQLHHFPHLSMYNFHSLHDDPADVRNVPAARHRHEPIAIAMGTTHMTLIDTLHGSIAATIALDHVPVGPTTIGDCDGDGMNDLLVTTATGYHGFIVRRHASGSTTAMVLVVGLMISLILYVSRHGMDFDIFGNTAGVQEEDEDLNDAPILGRSSTAEGLRRRVSKRSTD